jgi:hypothetical protein
MYYWDSVSISYKKFFTIYPVIFTYFILLVTRLCVFNVRLLY